LVTWWLDGDVRELDYGAGFGSDCRPKLGRWGDCDAGRWMGWVRGKEKRNRVTQWTLGRNGL
jgi:hypothetical protein